MSYMKTSDVKQRISGGVILAMALIMLIAYACEKAPAFAAEEEAPPEVRYVVSMITWYGETKPFKQEFSFKWQTACETFRINTTEKMDGYRKDPKFGFIMGDICKRELQE